MPESAKAQLLLFRPRRFVHRPSEERQEENRENEREREMDGWIREYKLHLLASVTLTELMGLNC